MDSIERSEQNLFRLMRSLLLQLSTLKRSLLMNSDELQAIDSKL